MRQDSGERSSEEMGRSPSISRSRSRSQGSYSESRESEGARNPRGRSPRSDRAGAPLNIGASAECFAAV
eukprot:7590158-Alexandrium_andersonii.AAC.1